MTRYQIARNRVENINKSIVERARKACNDAGLDGSILGIHVHNAWVSYQSGNPWPGVDYSKVRLARRLLDAQWEASRIVDKWCARIYAEKGQQKGYEYLHR